MGGIQAEEVVGEAEAATTRLDEVLQVTLAVIKPSREGRMLYQLLVKMELTDRGSNVLVLRCIFLGCLMHSLKNSEGYWQI